MTKLSYGLSVNSSEFMRGKIVFFGKKLNNKGKTNIG